MHFRKLRSLLFVGFLSLLFLSIGCKKSVDNKLIGKWNVVNVDNFYGSYLEQWEFTKEQKIIIYATGSPNDTGQYITNVRLGKRYVELADCNSATHNQKWRIMRLNKKDMHLIIETDHGLTFKEFTRVP